jgi:hypothetical protein
MVIQVFSIKGPSPLQSGDDHKNVNVMGSFKNLIWTWHKSFLEGDDSGVLKEGNSPLQGELIVK